MGAKCTGSKYYDLNSQCNLKSEKRVDIDPTCARSIKYEDRYLQVRAHPQGRGRLPFLGPQELWQPRQRRRLVSCHRRSIQVSCNHHYVFWGI